MVNALCEGKVYKLDISNKFVINKISSHIALNKWLDSKPRKCLIMYDNNAVFENIPHGLWYYNGLLKYMIEVKPFIQEEFDV